MRALERVFGVLVFIFIFCSQKLYPVTPALSLRSSSSVSLFSYSSLTFQSLSVLPASCSVPVCDDNPLKMLLKTDRVIYTEELILVVLGEMIRKAGYYCGASSHNNTAGACVMEVNRSKSLTMSIKG